MECTAEPLTRTFFEAFVKSSAAGDAEGVAKFFAPSFLAAGPNGAQVVKSSDMSHVVSKRKQVLAAMGCSSATLVSLNETKLDERFRLVRTEWQWQLNPDGQSPSEIRLPSTFIVQQSSDGLQIVFYLPHGDITAVLRERGMMAAS